MNEAARQTFVAFARGPNLENLAAFYGIERKESNDDELRKKILTALDGLTGAGTRLAYISHTKNSPIANSVADVNVFCPEPANERTGKVSVVVLLEDQEETLSEIPESDLEKYRYNLTKKIKEHLTRGDKIPVNDKPEVFIAKPTESIMVKASIFLERGVEAEVVKKSCIESLKNWISQNERIGRSVSVGMIKAALASGSGSAGLLNVQEIEIREPKEDVKVDKLSYPKFKKDSSKEYAVEIDVKIVDLDASEIDDI